jgi:hypothetical protein
VTPLGIDGSAQQMRAVATDLFFITSTLTCSAILGAPLCRLLPKSVFNYRAILAPVLGFGAFGILSTIAYVYGVAPQLSASIACVITLVIGVSYLIAERRLPLNRRWLAFTGIFLLLLLVLMLPGWIGGPSFVAFQGNPYDQLNYVSYALAYRSHSFAALSSLQPSDPLYTENNFNVFAAHGLDSRPTVIIALSSLFGVYWRNVLDSAYPYMVVLQALSFFSFTFLLVECFQTPLMLAAVVAFAFVAGFYLQYVLDINAWGELAGIAFAVALFSVFSKPLMVGFGNVERRQQMGAAAGVAVLLASLLYFYPEISSIYAVAIAVSAVMVIIIRPHRVQALRDQSIMFGGAILGVAFCIPLYDATLGTLLRQIQVAPPKAWAYFYSGYFLHDASLGALGSGIAAHINDLAYTLAGVLGIYYVFPSSVGTGYDEIRVSFILVFAFALVAATAIALWRICQDNPRILVPFAGAAGALLVPIALAADGRMWESGKGFSMASPLLFSVLVLPLTTSQWKNVLATPALVLVALNFSFGIDRLFVAVEPFGIGRATPYPSSKSVKRSYDYDWRHWAEELKGCRAVSVYAESIINDRMAQIFLAEASLKWSSEIPVVNATAGASARMQPQIASPDCIMTDQQSIRSGKENQSIIQLSRANGPRRPFPYKGGSQEIAVDDEHDIAIQGLYPIEAAQAGNRRRTNGDAKIFVSTSPEALPTWLSVELTDGGPVKTAEVDLNGGQLYSGPAWVGSKKLNIPLGTRAGIWQLEIKSDTFRSDDYPLPLGLLLTSVRLSR